QSGGTLPSWRFAALAVALGLGGTITAAASYVAYVHAGDEQILARGWPIVCAADVFLCVALARAIFQRGLAVTIVVVLALVSDVIALVITSRRPFGAADPRAIGLLAIAIGLSLLLRRAGVRSMWA